MKPLELAEKILQTTHFTRQERKIIMNITEITLREYESQIFNLIALFCGLLFGVLIGVSAPVTSSNYKLSATSVTTSGKVEDKKKVKENVISV